VLSVAPTFLGGGKRLFDGIDRSAVGLEIIEVLGSPKVTHLRYAVKNPESFELRAQRSALAD
jgi:hypothetical protein